LAGGTRPDIAFTVNRLSRYTHCAKTGHWAALIHLLKYLKGTVEKGLQFGGDIWNNEHDDMTSDSNLKSYSDASLCDNDDGTSTVGQGHFMTGANGAALISWKSGKEKHGISISTQESEYKGASMSTNTALWMQDMFHDMDYPCKLPSTLYVDNEPAVKAINQPTLTSTLRHLKKHLFNVRDAVHDSKLLKVKSCSTANMLADIFTKGLGGKTHRDMMTRIGMVSIYPSSQGEC
jgi:hypothetical protein